MEPIVFPSIDEESWRPIHAAFDTTLEIADDFTEELFMLPTVFEDLRVQFNLLCKLGKPAPAEIFLIFEYDVMHVPELTLEGGSFGSHSGIQ